MIGHETQTVLESQVKIQKVGDMKDFEKEIKLTEGPGKLEYLLESGATRSDLER